VASHNASTVAAFNAWLRGACARRGHTLLDTHALTAGAWSHDGVHFQSAVNVLLAQVMLNILDELPSEEGQPPPGASEAQAASDASWDPSAQVSSCHPGMHIGWEHKSAIEWWGAGRRRQREALDVGRGEDADVR
jgi:hypothetical protein